MNIYIQEYTVRKEKIVYIFRTVRLEWAWRGRQLVSNKFIFLSFFRFFLQLFFFLCPPLFSSGNYTELYGTFSANKFRLVNLYIQIFDFFQHKSNIFSSRYIMIYRPSHHSRAESWLILINSIGPLVFYPLVIIIQKRNNLVLSIIKFYNPPPLLLYI